MKDNVMKTYNVWKAKANCEPIEGTDRLVSAPSKRWVLEQIAYEEGVKHNRNHMVVKLPNGEIWCASQI